MIDSRLLSRRWFCSRGLISPSLSTYFQGGGRNRTGIKFQGGNCRLGTFPVPWWISLYFKTRPNIDRGISVSFDSQGCFNADAQPTKCCNNYEKHACTN